ncbi:hypothetical protein [Legionella sp. CNM-4043-24]|uniref:hypothetical protein n=1 Tax=Legionella sp. CNM-4043-24 TaxID=3421646 RepID=UPI00403AA3D2
MNKKLNIPLQSIKPFMVLGFAIALIIGLLMMLSYLVIWGLVIGAVLWLAATVKRLLFPPRIISRQQGRIIDYPRDKK